MSITTTLSGPRRAPRTGGKPAKLVVLLHGVGADGNDLISLADSWAPLLPTAEFLSPDGPQPCDMAPFGRQWFSLQNRTAPAMLAGIRATAPILDTFLDQALAERGLTDADLALVGFSQGTMMSLYVGPRRPHRLAGILGYSGALLGADNLPADARSRPPVQLVHGDADPIVPFEAMAHAEAGLVRAGIEVATAARPGLPHGIDPGGLEVGAAFLRSVLG